MMSATQIAFYAISAIILAGGLLAVTSTKIFRAAIWLLTSLIGIAALYLLMEMNFIAAVQIVVYVGGIVVLIIFSIFLTQESGKQMPRPTLQRIIFSALAALSGIAFTYNILRTYNFKPAAAQVMDNRMTTIGEQLLDTRQHGYILPFEVVSVLLLAAMVGCIVIAMKPAAEPASTVTKIKIKESDEPGPGLVSLPVEQLIKEEA